MARAASEASTTTDEVRSSQDCLASALASSLVRSAAASAAVEAPPRSLGDGPLARSLSLSLVLLLSLLLVNLAPGAFLDGLVLVQARGGSLVLFAGVSRGFVFGLDCRVFGLLGILRSCRARSRNLRGAPLRGQVGSPTFPFVACSTGSTSALRETSKARTNLWRERWFASPCVFMAWYPRSSHLASFLRGP